MGIVFSQRALSDLLSETLRNEGMADERRRLMATLTTHLLGTAATHPPIGRAVGGPWRHAMGRVDGRGVVLRYCADRDSLLVVRIFYGLDRQG